MRKRGIVALLVTGFLMAMGTCFAQSPGKEADKERARAVCDIRAGMSAEGMEARLR